MIECMTDEHNDYFDVDFKDMERIYRLIEALSTDGFQINQEVVDEAKEILEEFNGAWFL